MIKSLKQSQEKVKTGSKMVKAKDSGRGLRGSRLNRRRQENKEQMHQRSGEIQEEKGVIYDLAPNLE